MDRYQSTFQTYNKLASAYQDKFMHLDLYNDTYDLFCNLIVIENAGVFEIGCGPGNITRYMLSKRPDLKIQAIDAAPEMIRLAKLNNPAADFKVMDCRKIYEISLKFDGIICGFCLPYLSKEDCEKLIGDCSRLLNKDGVLYLSAIEGDYERSGYQYDSSGENKVYVHYYQSDDLIRLLTQNNFQIKHLIRKEYLQSDETTSTHIIIIAVLN